MDTNIILERVSQNIGLLNTFEGSRVTTYLDNGVKLRMTKEEKLVAEVELAVQFTEQELNDLAALCKHLDKSIDEVIIMCIQEYSQYLIDQFENNVPNESK